MPDFAFWEMCILCRGNYNCSDFAFCLCALTEVLLQCRNALTQFEENVPRFNYYYCILI